MHALIIESQYFPAALIEDCLQPLGFDTFALASDRRKSWRARAERFPDLITADPVLTICFSITPVKRICRATRIGA